MDIVESSTAIEDMARHTKRLAAGLQARGALTHKGPTGTVDSPRRPPLGLLAFLLKTAVGSHNMLRSQYEQ